MLDIKFIRENRDLVEKATAKKHLEVDIGKLLKLDVERLELLQVVEGMRSKQHRAGATLAASKSGGQDADSKLLGELAALKTKLRAEEEKLADIVRKWQTLMLSIPNIPDVSVPEGATDAENVELRRVGEPRKFDFKVKDHRELMMELGMVDFERGVKTSGFRGYFLTGAGVRLSFAVWQFALTRLSAQGFMPMMAPSLIRREMLLGTGYLPQGEDDLFMTQDGMYLAGTSEVAGMGYFMDEVIPVTQLPKKMLAFSPCFRREAGSYGKDEKGLFRVHEFFKLEQLVISQASHEESVRLHEEITKNSESLMAELGIPYRVVVNCGGDLGLGQVKKYDTEAWVPSEGRYRETHSSSYFHDFQSRRLNIRYRDEGGKLNYVHSLNNTAVATPRILQAIVENYQEADGSIRIPSVLREYAGIEVIKKEK